MKLEKEAARDGKETWLSLEGDRESGGETRIQCMKLSNNETGQLKNIYYKKNGKATYIYHFVLCSLKIFFCQSIIEDMLLIQIYKLQIKVIRRATHFLFSLKPEKVFLLWSSASTHPTHRTRLHLFATSQSKSTCFHNHSFHLNVILYMSKLLLWFSCPHTSHKKNQYYDHAKKLS